MNESFYLYGYFGKKYRRDGDVRNVHRVYHNTHAENSNNMSNTQILSGLACHAHYLAFNHNFTRAFFSFLGPFDSWHDKQQHCS